MKTSNDFFMRMTKEAQEELASGKKGWRNIDTNTLLLVCFGMLTDHLSAKIAKPLWFFATSVCAGVITYITKQILG